MVFQAPAVPAYPERLTVPQCANGWRKSGPLFFGIEWKLQLLLVCSSELVVTPKVDAQNFHTMQAFA